MEKLEQQFICVRIIKADGLDLDLFQFDYDQTWCVVFLNADRTIYGRYGTRAGVRNNAASHISVAGFKKAMQRALEVHQGYPANKQNLAAHAGPKAKYATPEKIPHMAKTKCIHCHQVHDGILRTKWLQKELTAADLWVFPLPESIGLRMDPADCLVVKKVTPGSPAAQGGIEAGDRLKSVNGLLLLSQADLQWALHIAPVETKLKVKLERAGQVAEKTVTLSGKWKEGDLSWRESSWFGLRQGLHLVPLPEAERKKRSLEPDMFAFKVQNMYGPGPEPLRKAGLKVGDVILAVDGRADLATETQLFVYIRLTHPPGSHMKLSLLRGDKKMELEVPAW
ncbi:MAG: PDZ domain-containing protein [Gemmataceae bacterium]|nr:PDZ domain-containing protein [Gemmataceae bacterium]MCI0741986.1 PDZ domain-containing protein [Gemmataceae bacterium]